jgi:hypothetical protein
VRMVNNFSSKSRKNIITVSAGSGCFDLLIHVAGNNCTGRAGGTAKGTYSLEENHIVVHLIRGDIRIPLDMCCNSPASVH